MIDFKMLQLILFYFYLGSSYTAALLPQQIVPPVQQGQVIGCLLYTSDAADE